MIFDDHDVRDDWNTSAVWRARDAREAVVARPDPVRDGLLLGLPAPGQPVRRTSWPPTRTTRRSSDTAGTLWPLLVELADRADAEADGGKGVRFSFRWDLGHSRFLMIDSRNGRLLDDDQHLMLGDAEFDWIEQQVAAPGPGRTTWSSAPRCPGCCRTPSATWRRSTRSPPAGPGWRGRLGEAIRQGADLEHWSAFRESFDRLTAMIEQAAASGPATVSVLSGDVHHSYAARADLPSRPAGGCTS